MRPLTLLLLMACSAPTVEDSQPSGEVPDGGVIQLTTRDDVQLVADFYPVETGAPAVVLLHMTPACCDRTDWPSTFIGSLTARGYAVLVPDRRGAGESGGVGDDAHLGEKGRYDVEAAMAHAAQYYGPIALIGASNGTTSMVDYAVWAPGEGLVEPAVLGFMTGGNYTENQTEVGGWLAPTPSFFTYSTDERAWSVDQQSHDSGNWTFLEYPSGDHGTRMFDAAPQVGADILTALAGPLGD